jgi:type 1 fimbria pilin
MKTLTKRLCTVACLSSALFSGVAMAATSGAQGGVIHFVGSIVEDPCNISTGSQHIAMHCNRAGQVHTSAISFQQAATGQVVNNEAATVSMRYINPQKTLGIVTIAYR